jgi:hypothetical protein
MRIVLTLAAMGLALCLSSGCSGMVKTPEDRANTYSEVADTDARQLTDDWDLFWLADRQYRLSKWHLK